MSDRIKSLAQQEIDWTYLVELARWNGVTPVLHRSLTTAGADAVPEAILKDLADHCRGNVIRSLLMTAELLKLLELFDAHGIQAIPFKGPVLAASAYGDVALREFCDLDILIRKRDLRRTRNLLVAQGYKSYRWNLERPDCGLTVELHWWEFPQSGISCPDDRRDVWDRRNAVSLLGSTVPALAPEDTLLALYTHGSRHCWDRLTLVCDLAQFISTQPQMDWTRVLERATKTGTRRRLLWGLLLAGDLLGVPVPPEVSALAADDRRVMALVGDARRRILCPPCAAFGNVESWASQLRAMERLRDRIRFCLDLLLEGFRPNKTDRHVVPLPRCLHVLYYVIHPIRMAVTYGPRAVRHLVRRSS